MICKARPLDSDIRAGRRSFQEFLLQLHGGISLHPTSSNQPLAEMNGHHAGTSNKVDVFICGSGSAGLSTATWLARCGIRCKIVDSRPGPLVIGQADGAQVRTVEIFESFGLAEELLRLGYHNIEVSFWNPGEKGSGIVRTRSAAATHPGLSHLPRVILSQAKFNGLLLDAMKRFSGQEVDYGHKVVEVLVDEEKANDMDAYPVTIVTEKNGEKETFKAKYALVSATSLCRTIELA